MRDVPLPIPPRRSLRKQLLQVHKWLSLAVAGLWLLQAVTGTLIVFHWEWDDATIAAAHAPTDFAAIERRLAVLAPRGSGRHITSVWTSAGLADRYDISVADDRAATSTSVRVTGDGTPIRVIHDGERSLADAIVVLHQTLLSGDTGSWIIGLSGALLVSNLIGGLVIAWPRAGQWRRALTPARKGPAAARHYSWHRALGLVAVVPALVLVGSGTLRVFDGGVTRLVGAQEIAMPPRPGMPAIGFARAVAVGLHAVPGAAFTAVDMPSADDATYKVRLRMPHEWRRAYGSSYVFVDGVSGAVRGIFRADAAPWPRAFMDGQFPLHTGEAGGLVGRLLVMALGLWLATMIIVGARLWWLRRTAKRRTRA